MSHFVFPHLAGKSALHFDYRQARNEREYIRPAQEPRDGVRALLRPIQLDHRAGIEDINRHLQAIFTVRNDVLGH